MSMVLNSKLVFLRYIGVPIYSISIWVRIKYLYINLILLSSSSSIHVYYINYISLCNLAYLLVGMFYYTITNIDPSLRSKLDAIMLLAVANFNVINRYGIDEILKPFIEEMMELEHVKSFKNNV